MGLVRHNKYCGHSLDHVDGQITPIADLVAVKVSGGYILTKEYHRRQMHFGKRWHQLYNRALAVALELRDA